MSICEMTLFWKDRGMLIASRDFFFPDFSGPCGIYQ